MMKKDLLPDLIDNTEVMGEILKLSAQGVRNAARLGLVPVVQIGPSSWLARRDALLEARRQGRYWTKEKRRRDALARIAAEDAAQSDERALLG